MYTKDESRDQLFVLNKDEPSLLTQRRRVIEVPFDERGGPPQSSSARAGRARGGEVGTDLV